MPISISGTTGITLSGQFDSASSFGFKNRIINGAMVIDQRNAGAAIASVGSGVVYTVDRFFIQCDSSSRFSFQQNQGSVTPPTGFTNYAGFTSLGANSPTASQYNVFNQGIEGLNAGDLAWGTTNAATVTLSFWVRSSVTGSLGGAILNASGNRSYSFLYTINSANTWEFKTVTIAGDTTGTWATNNGAFAYLRWSLGTGSSLITTPNQWNASNSNGATGQVNISTTNGATFYITGVQLEKGSTATSFDYRPYGTELQLCQRYYEKSYSMASIAGASTNTGKGSFVCATGNTFWRWTQNYRVSKRADSTFTIYSTTGASGNVRLNNASDLAVSTEDAGENATAIYVSRNASVGDFFWWQWTASAEL